MIPDVDFGLDSLFPRTDIHLLSTAVNVGHTLVVHSGDNGVFVEQLDSGRPIPIQEERADAVGFFGTSADFLAVATGSRLDVWRISYDMELLARFVVVPGSTFISQSAQAHSIGAIHPDGTVFVISEKRPTQMTATPFKFPSLDYHPLWGSQGAVAGYCWTQGDKSNVFIRNVDSNNVEKKGTTFASTKSLHIKAVWARKEERRYEVFFVYADEPHRLMRFHIDSGASKVSEVCSFDRGAIIDQVACSPATSKPLVVTAYNDCMTYAKSLVADDALTNYVKDIATSTEFKNIIRLSGTTSSLIWSSTPVTAPIVSVDNYRLPQSRPREVVSQKINTTYTLPMTNIIRKFRSSDNQALSFRLISPTDYRTHTSMRAFVIVDYDGRIAAGHYSPTVEALYQLGYPVVIVPVKKRWPKHHEVIANAALDVKDVVHEVIKLNIATSATVIVGSECAAAISSLLGRKSSPIKSVIAVDPKAKDVDKIHHKNINKVTRVVTGDSVDDGVKIRTLVARELGDTPASQLASIVKEVV